MLSQRVELPVVHEQVSERPMIDRDRNAEAGTEGVFELHFVGKPGIVCAVRDDDGGARPQQPADRPGGKFPPELLREGVRKPIAVFDVQVFRRRVDGDDRTRLAFEDADDPVDNQVEDFFVLIGGREDLQNVREVLETFFVSELDHSGNLLSNDEITPLM